MLSKPTENRLQRVQEYALTIKNVRKKIKVCKAKLTTSPRRPTNDSVFLHLEYTRAVKDDAKCLNKIAPVGFQKLIHYLMKNLLLNKPENIFMFVCLLLEDKLVNASNKELNFNYNAWFNNWRKTEDEKYYCDADRCKITADKDAAEEDMTDKDMADKDTKNRTLFEATKSEESSVGSSIGSSVSSAMFVSEKTKAKDDCERCMAFLLEGKPEPKGLDCKAMFGDPEEPHDICHDVPLQPDPPLDTRHFTQAYRKEALKRKEVSEKEESICPIMMTCADGSSDAEYRKKGDEPQTKAQQNTTMPSKAEENMFEQFELLCQEEGETKAICTVIAEASKVVDVRGSVLQGKEDVMKQSVNTVEPKETIDDDNTTKVGSDVSIG